MTCKVCGLDKMVVRENVCSDCEKGTKETKKPKKKKDKE